MSGEQKNNQPKAQSEQAQQIKQSDWQRKGHQSFEPKKKDAEVIPFSGMGLTECNSTGWRAECKIDIITFFSYRLP
jgi:hypothetical protein